MGSFLRKFGAIALKVTEIAVGVAPMAQMLYPQAKDQISTISHDLAQMATIIQQVEVFGQALEIKGPDKLKAATPAIAQIILQSSLLAKRKIDNPELFKAGCQKMADGLADVLNSLEA